MPVMTLLNADTDAIELTEANWIVNGTSVVNKMVVNPVTTSELKLGAGIDEIYFYGKAKDYTISTSGTTLTIASTDGLTIAKMGLVKLSLGGDKLIFSDGSLIAGIDTVNSKYDIGGQTLNMVSSNASQALDYTKMTKFDTTVNSKAMFPLLPSIKTDFILDGQGINEISITIDALSDSFNFKDDISQSNNVTILNFGADDSITITDSTTPIHLTESELATEYDSAFSSDGKGSISIAYNHNNQVNDITLTGITPIPFAYDVNSFNALSIGNILFL